MLNTEFGPFEFDMLIKDLVSNLFEFHIATIYVERSALYVMDCVQGCY